jgi:7-keto-8-aminopelargonate synthetase-like enzyme
VERLQRNGRVLREALAEQGLASGQADTHIVPLLVGDPGAAVAASEQALERGVFAQAIRPPTVPAGSSRMRLSVMASHTESELRAAARILAAVVPGQVRSPESEPEPEREAASPQVFDHLADAA